MCTPAPGERTPESNGSVMKRNMPVPHCCITGGLEVWTILSPCCTVVDLQDTLYAPEQPSADRGRSHIGEQMPLNRKLSPRHKL